MIRTRDFLLFIATLVFLFAGISWSVARDIATPTLTSGEGRVSLNTNDAGFVATYEGGDTLDRAERLRVLKEKLKDSVISTRNVEEESDAIETGDITTGRSQVRQDVFWCGDRIATSARAERWPQSDVEIQFVEGARIVQVHESEISIQASSTKETSTTRALLQLPVFSSRATESVCVDDLAVGVTFDGRLMLNNSAEEYVELSQYDLIGYARDGFPIYGVYTEVSKLDECGGLSDVSGYRYHIRVGDPNILKCFGGVPAKFIE